MTNPPARPRVGLLVTGGVVLVGLLVILLEPTSDVPTRLIHKISAVLRDGGAPSWFASETLWERALNVVLFLPVGAVLTTLLPRWSLARITIVGALASIAVEAVQMVFLPGRDGSAWDVATNTVGTFLGALAAVTWNERRGANARRYG